MSKYAEFVKSDLLPEMVHNRCFCEAASREFVEFESSSVDPLESVSGNSEKPWECYRANAVVRFSGEAETFPLIVKLLSPSARSENAFARFQNEEMFYSKMLLVYGKDRFPKCYLSDLGRYGMPVIVLEDLTASGYETVQRKLNEDELKLCLESLAKLHGTGLRLKAEKFEIFREFYAKLLETTFDSESISRHEETFERILESSKSLRDSSLAEETMRALGSNPLEIARRACTEIDMSCICHGAFSRGKVFFRRDETNGRAVDAKMIDWQTMRYCSPAIDLGAILFTNFPASTTVEVEESSSSRVRRFLQEMLAYYVEAVKREYPAIMCERLKQEIVRVLPATLSYVILCSPEDFKDEKSIEAFAECSKVLRDPNFSF
ncbi:hypothetical protein KPH14_007407 [Odynerus spinipes]|uniref:CHK kinase-like domain-containing protein n=1 Tax=Odynerus spinipes TaxID=1348599 RepID=A0AAD9RAU6_9HYME|nr:hypothetical protein KPH14_007407 [Odynerus spinipes]